jgi:hypothetical protein
VSAFVVDDRFDPHERLFVAGALGKIELVTTLLDSGVSPAKFVLKETPFHIAKERTQTVVLTTMLEHRLVLAVDAFCGSCYSDFFSFNFSRIITIAALDIADRKVQRLPPFLVDMMNLKELDFSHNHLGTSAELILSRFFENSSSIQNFR